MLRLPPISTLFPYTTLFRSLLEGTLQAGTSAVSDKLLDLVGLGGKSAADKGKDTRDYLAADLPPSRSEERFSRNAETDLVCRLLLEKKKKIKKKTVEQNDYTHTHDEHHHSSQTV